MTGSRIAAAVLTAIAWLMAIAAGVWLWQHANSLRYYLLCWPANDFANRWRVELAITDAMTVLNLLLPAAATLCIRHRPRIAAIVAAIQIVLMPIAFVA